MGNEASSVKIHSLLTAEDLKSLRASFESSGAASSTAAGKGAAPSETVASGLGAAVHGLGWGPWASAWPNDLRARLEAVMATKSAKPSGAALVTFTAYQELAGSCVRGPTEERVKLLLRLAEGGGGHVDDAELASCQLQLDRLLSLVQALIQVATRLVLSQRGTRMDEDKALESASRVLAASLMHDVIWPGKPRKDCLLLQPELDILQKSSWDFDAIEKWMVMGGGGPLFDRIFRMAMGLSFGLQTGEELALLPTMPLDLKALPASSMMTVPDMFFLDGNLPLTSASGSKASAAPAPPSIRWRPLFNSATDGESFTKFCSALLAKKSQTATVILIREAGGSGRVFGGYASHPWKLCPKFYGSGTSFLFSLRPKDYVYEAVGHNTNYQYLNVKAKTLPNGMGFGGQLEYFGLWLDAEFGKASCAPTCSTYVAPMLSSKPDFVYDRLEAWGIGDEPCDEEDEDGDDDGGQGARARGALAKDPEAMAVMEMMGKTFISKDVMAADENDAKRKAADVN